MVQDLVDLQANGWRKAKLLEAPAMLAQVKSSQVGANESGNVETARLEPSWFRREPQCTDLKVHLPQPSLTKAVLRGRAAERTPKAADATVDSRRRPRLCNGATGQDVESSACLTSDVGEHDNASTAAGHLDSRFVKRTFGYLLEDDDLQSFVEDWRQRERCVGVNDAGLALLIDIGIGSDAAGGDVAAKAIASLLRHGAVPCECLREALQPRVAQIADLLLDDPGAKHFIHLLTLQLAAVSSCRDLDEQQRGELELLVQEARGSIDFYNADQSEIPHDHLEQEDGAAVISAE